MNQFKDKNITINITLFIVKVVFLILIARLIQQIINIPMHICILLVGITWNFKDKDKIKIKSIKDKKWSGLITLSIVIIFSELIMYNFFYLKKYNSINLYYYNIITPIIIFQMFNCLIEEYFFRYLLFEKIKLQVLDNRKYKILISSFIFGLYHVIFLEQKVLISYSLALFIATSLAGIGLGTIYEDSSNWIYVAILHSIYNIMQNLMILNLDMDKLNINNTFIMSFYLGGLFILLSIIYRTIFYNKNKLFKS